MKLKKFYMTFIFLLVFVCTKNILLKEIVILGDDESVKLKVAKPVTTTLLNDIEGANIKEKDYNFFSKEVEVFANDTDNLIELDIFGLPIKTVELNHHETKKVYPSGKAIAIKMNTDGVLVLNIGNVNDIDGNIVMPSENKLNVGDIIYKVNDEVVENKEQLSRLIEESDGEIKLTVKQKEKINEVDIMPVKSIEDNEYKIGIWVRDSTQGIGTITFITTNKEKFYALGHGIIDIDTKDLMTVKDGEAKLTEIISIQKGEKGVPGELIGEIKTGDAIGTIESNKSIGVSGKILKNYKNDIALEEIEVARKEEVKIGPATILSNIDTNIVKSYDVFIDKVDEKSSSSKSITLTITDEELISKTGGIVQGMSGSPIIQNEKIIGAVTHVFVQNPKRGYGIFLEDMF